MFFDPPSPPRIAQKILAAAQIGDIDRLANLLQRYSDVDLSGVINLKGEGGETALACALRSNCPDWVTELLLKAGADPNQGRLEGMSTMYWGNGISTKRMLLKAGGKPDFVNKAGETQLSAYLWAATRSNKDQRAKNEYASLASLFLDYGANPDLPNKDGNTALHDTKISNLSQNFLQKLLKASHNLNTRNARGETPLMIAVDDEVPLEMFDTLLAAGADPTLQDYSGQTLLARAVRRGSADDPEKIARILQHLIEKGADPWAVFDRQFTVLNVLELRTDLSESSKQAIARTLLPEMFLPSLWKNKTEGDVVNAWARVPQDWRPLGEYAMSALLRELRGGSPQPAPARVPVPVRARPSGPETLS